METKKESIIYDDTSWEVNESNPVERETVNNPVSENESAKAKSNSNTLKNTVTAVAGVAVGAAGIAALGFRHAPEPMTNPEPQPEPVPEPVQFDGAEVPVAQNVNDDMSFSEAFASARHEVGPGGVFAWHGGIYGTYYVNEWQDFSDDYKQSFSNYAYDVKVEPYNDESLLASEPSGEDLQSELSLDEVTVEEVPIVDEPVLAEVPLELPIEEFPVESEPVLAEQPAEELTIEDEPALAEFPVEDVSIADEPAWAELPVEEFPMEEEPVLAEQPVEGLPLEEEAPVVVEQAVMDVVQENEDKVVIINSPNMIATNTDDVENYDQNISVIPVDVDGQDVAIVGTNVDDDYSITIVDDDFNSEQWANDGIEDGSVNLAEEYQEIPETSETTQDATNDYSNEGDFMPDFSNNDNISDF